MTDMQQNGIWFRPVTAREAQYLCVNTLPEHLGIEITEILPDTMIARMPVDQRTKQTFGLLHGGASLALAETVASIAANLTVDHNRFFCVGLEINANHIRPVSHGFVTATAKPFHMGKTTQIWSIEIHNELKQLVCISRFTLAVKPYPPEQ
jgi:1,4-dihydroxy-2-naphthoyl-CoA hydrolase